MIELSSIKRTRKGYKTSKASKQSNKYLNWRRINTNIIYNGNKSRVSLGSLKVKNNMPNINIYKNVDS